MQFISAATLVSSIFSKCQNLLIFFELIPISNAHGVKLGILPKSTKIDATNTNKTKISYYI